MKFFKTIFILAFSCSPFLSQAFSASSSDESAEKELSEVFHVDSYISLGAKKKLMPTIAKVTPRWIIRNLVNGSFVETVLEVHGAGEFLKAENLYSVLTGQAAQSWAMKIGKFCTPQDFSNMLDYVEARDLITRSQRGDLQSEFRRLPMGGLMDAVKVLAQKIEPKKESLQDKIVKKLGGFSIDEI